MLKRIILSFIALAASLGLYAQGIPNGSVWFDGMDMYKANVLPVGIIQLSTTNAGQKVTFELTPLPGSSGQYTMFNPADINDEKIDDFVMQVEEDGRDMLVVYRENKIYKLFEKTDKSFHEIVFDRWLPTVDGKFMATAPDGTVVHAVIDDWTVTVDGEDCPFQAVTRPNGHPFDVLNILTGPIKGVWYLARTVDGFNAYRSEIGEDGGIKIVEETPWVLTWEDSDEPRWSFLSTEFVIPSFYKKSTLTLMRNTIQAMHGYVFPDKKLNKYFQEQPWYQPVANNGAVRLNFIEQMNIARLLAEESKPDAERRLVTEEEPGGKKKSGK